MQYWEKASEINRGKVLGWIKLADNELLFETSKERLWRKEQGLPIKNQDTREQHKRGEEDLGNGVLR